LFGGNRLTCSVRGPAAVWIQGFLQLRSPTHAHHGFLALVVGLFATAHSSFSAGAEPPAKGHLELMKAAVSSLEAETEDVQFKAALTLVSKPLLRYSDPTRGAFGGANVLLDGGVWRLGTKGRPTALVTIEIYGGTDEPRL